MVEACVYVAWSEDMRAVKIGVSSKPHRRMCKIKNQGHGLPMLYWHTKPVPRAHSIERAAHVRLHKSRLNGEWFCVLPETAIRVIRKAMRQINV